MKKQIPIYKKKNQNKSHREAFSAVAKLWKKQNNKNNENVEEEVVVQQVPPKILKINQIKVNQKKKPAKKPDKKKTGGRKPSAYQLFMKKQIPLYKKKNPKKSHREAFSAVAKSWKKQKN